MSLVRINISLTQEQHTYLKGVCNKEGVSVSQLIRLALGEYLRNHTDGIGLKTDSNNKQVLPIMGSAVTLVRCESPRFCKITKTKKYEIPIKDEDGNEKEVIKYLCETHKQGREVVKEIL